MKEITVLMSVYYGDNPFFLEESLKSLQNQTIPAKKIILICDGLLSNKLYQVLEKWKLKLPLEIHSYENNMGLAHALNYGIKFIETELVARMDSDDICFPDRFEKQLVFFENNSDIEILGTGISEFYLSDNGKEFRKNRLYPFEISKESKSLFKGTPLGHPTVMIRSALLKDFCYSENTRMCEDIDLWFRLIQNGHKIYNLQESLLNFRITDSTFKRRSISKALSEFRIYWKNLFLLFGFTPMLIYPIMRLFVRFLPYTLNKKIYFSQARKRFFNF